MELIPIHSKTKQDSPHENQEPQEDMLRSSVSLVHQISNQPKEVELNIPSHRPPRFRFCRRNEIVIREREREIPQKKTSEQNPNKKKRGNKKKL